MDILNHPFDDIADVRCQLDEARQRPGWWEKLNQNAGIDTDTPNFPSPDNWIS